MLSNQLIQLAQVTVLNQNVRENLKLKHQFTNIFFIFFFTNKFTNMFLFTACIVIIITHTFICHGDC